jgi:hypothetical protein
LNESQQAMIVARLPLLKVGDVATQMSAVHEIVDRPQPIEQIAETAKNTPPKPMPAAGAAGFVLCAGELSRCGPVSPGA